MNIYLTDLQKRFLLFLLGCIPSRLLISYLAFISNKNQILKIILSLFLLSISISFILIYIFKLRDTGLETMGNKIWWNSLRPLHGLLYGLSGLIILFNLFNKKSNIYSSLILLLDTLIGLISFIIFHYTNKL